MAQETEVVVFEVDVSSYEKSLADLTKSINGLKDTQAALQKQTKEGATGAAESLEKVNAQLKLQQQEYRTTQNILVGYTGAQQKNVNTLDFAKNSIQANRDLLKQLTAQYINTTAPSEKFTNQIKKLSDELKKQEGAIGDNRRNVGAYAEGFKSAFESITSGVPALQGFATAQKGVNLALEANPIGAVIALLTGLVQIFSQNKEVADQLSFGMAALNKGFGFIIDTIVNTVGSFDKLTAAISSPIKFIRELASGTAQAAKEGYNASRAFDELTVANAKLNAEISVGQEKSDALTKSLKDRTKTEQERIKIANQIADLEVSNAQKLAKLRADELNALNLQNKNRTLSGEEQAKVIEKQGEVEVAQLQAVTAESQRQTRINILLDKEATAAAKENSNTRINIRREEVKSLEDTFKKEQELKDKAEEDNANRELNAQVVSAQITARRLGTVQAAIDAEIIAKNRLLQNESLTETERQNIIRQSEDKIAEIKKDSQEKTQEQAEQAAKKEFDTIVGIVSQVSNAVVGILGAVSSLIQQTAEQNIQSLQEQAGDGAAEQKRVSAESRQIKLKAWKEAKAINITMAVMNTANAVMAQISNPTPYVGFVLAALAAATGAIQIATIAKQKPPVFARQGAAIPIGGKSHEHGGTPIHVNGQQVAEAEAGEGLFIMKREAFQDIHMLSGWNQRYGGRSFTGNKTNFAADGGEIQIPSDGGFSTRSIRSATDNAMQVEMAILNGFKKAPAPELSIVELNSKQTSRNRSVDVVSL